MRHDYEEVDANAAGELMSRLREKLGTLAGQRVKGRKIAAASDFSYHDPVDGSNSTGRGIHIVFADNSRIVYRLSGTGMVGATLRVYIERLEPDVAKQDQDSQADLPELIAAADEMAGIRMHTGRQRPSVVT
ncbi:MAG TPA: hypothetical protein VNW90_17885 [Acetobacteraceae bacterium]|jgi:phosphoglucomutase|nr:hypothetical protein [Acetobacteraceae bacterium]